MRRTGSEVCEAGIDAGVRWSYSDYLQLVLPCGVSRHQPVATVSRRGGALVAIAEVTTVDANHVNGNKFLILT